LQVSPLLHAGRQDAHHLRPASVIVAPYWPAVLFLTPAHPLQKLRPLKTAAGLYNMSWVDTYSWPRKHGSKFWH